MIQGQGISGWSKTHNPPALTSSVLGLQVCASCPCVLILLTQKLLCIGHLKCNVIWLCFLKTREWTILNIPYLLRGCSNFDFFFLNHRQLQSGPWIIPPFLHGSSMPYHILPNTLIKRCLISITWTITAQGHCFSRGFLSSWQMRSLCMLFTSKLCYMDICFCGSYLENVYSWCIGNRPCSYSNKS